MKQPYAETPFNTFHFRLAVDPHVSIGVVEQLGCEADRILATVRRSCGKFRLYYLGNRRCKFIHCALFPFNLAEIVELLEASSFIAEIEMPRVVFS